MKLRYLSLLAIILLIPVCVWAWGIVGVGGGIPPSAGQPSEVARYRFENGALTTDSSTNSNTLTSNGTPVSDEGDFQEGAGSVALVRLESDYYSIADGGLSADFPLKNGTANSTFSITAWYKPTTSSNTAPIVSKYKVSTDQRSFRVGLDNAGKVNITIGHTNGTAFETYTHGTAVTDGRWYHIGATYNGSTKAYKIRIWDDFNTAILGSDLSGTGTNAISFETIEVRVGSYDAKYADGKLDNVKIYDTVLTDGQIDTDRGQS